jgi:hypothetical protein
MHFTLKISFSSKIIYNLIYERVYLLGERVKSKYPTNLGFLLFVEFGLFFHKKIFYKNFSEEIAKTPLKNAFFIKNWL